MSLKQYRQKRDFKKTSEPAGKKEASRRGHLYIIQKHAASHLHYDFRLEMNGVLKSWAVPKGPCLDPTVKRLAMHVEDHPIEYGSFEGIIPQGEYGGGTVMLWDRGTWQCEGDVNKAYEKGHLKFELLGEKLKGKWSLIRTSDDNKKWLLIKAKDEEAKKLNQYDVTVEEPLSIATGLSLDEIAKKKQNVWSSNKVKKSKDAQQIIHFDIKQLSKIKKQAQPELVYPQLATLVDRVPDDDEWLHEVKYDGYRLLSLIENNKVSLFTRRHNDWTKYFSPICKELKKLNLKNAILDGEVVAIDENNRSDFQLLQNTLKGEEKAHLIYYIFDIVYYQGYSLANTPLIERKQLLQTLLSNLGPDSVLRYSDHIIGQGAAVFKNACHMALEGIISKRLDSAYSQKRTKTWLKEKCIKRQEFVIGGFTEPKNSREYFGSLLIGFYNNKNQLQYCGHVGTGFTQASLREVHQLLTQYRQSKNPFIFKHKVNLKNITWLKPVVLTEVEFTEMTSAGILRHPSFKGIRADKSAREVKLEQPIESAKVAKVTITNSDKILYREQGITKGDIVNYYTRVSEWILPYIVNRPLTLVRCPSGYDKDCFYQKHLDKESSPFIHSISIQEKNKLDYNIYIKDLSGLIALAQMGVLEIHTWGSQIKSVEKPDTIVFDLDPDPSLEWKKVIEATFFVRDALELLELTSFVKATGGKGFHVVIPIKPKDEWDEVKAFTHKIADTIVQQKPDLFIANMSKAKRGGKIFLDYLRNGRGATFIAPYSTRARTGATVAVPLAWSELTVKMKSNYYTIKNLPKRLDKLSHDPWSEFKTIKQSITQKMKRTVGL